MLRLSALTLALAVATAAPAQSDPCPDDRVDPLPASTEYGRSLGCGGVEISAGGVRVDGRRTGTCPAFITHTPAYDGTEHVPNSGTYTRPIGVVRTITMTYTCAQDWVLFIPIGSSCRLVSTTVTATRATYGQYDCTEPVSG